MKITLLIGIASLLVGAVAFATPSTTFWAPSTTAVQGFEVGHLTYDTYFGKGTAPFAGSTASSGQANPPIYPVTTGFTMGVLPFEKLQAEVGFDLLLPTPDPFLLNAKVGSSEGALFESSPSWSFGAFGIGTKGGVTNYDILYLMFGKQIGKFGLPQIGGYYSLNKDLFLSSKGEVQRAGLLASWTFPDIKIDKPWLNKITPSWDIQTGNNLFGATGGGLAFYITSAISLLTGPVYYFDPDLQPGGSRWLWSLQLDVDLDFKSQK